MQEIHIEIRWDCECCFAPVETMRRGGSTRRPSSHEPQRNIRDLGCNDRGGLLRGARAGGFENRISTGCLEGTLPNIWSAEKRREREVKRVRERGQESERGGASTVLSESQEEHLSQNQIYFQPKFLCQRSESTECRHVRPTGKGRTGMSRGEKEGFTSSGDDEQA
jgi:hypothetical protein